MTREEIKEHVLKLREKVILMREKINPIKDKPPEQYTREDMLLLEEMTEVYNEYQSIMELFHNKA